jgi:hypothetical protein
VKDANYIGITVSHLRDKNKNNNNLVVAQRRFR